MSSIRLLISLASIFKWKLKQMDVNNAFLNGLLEEEVYMQQPEGYVVAWKEGMVCKLNKSLCGLKQAPRVWYGRIGDHLQSQGFQRSIADHTLYYKVQGKDIVLVILYVDDLILMGRKEYMVEDVQSKLSKEFEMKDLGELHYILYVDDLILTGRNEAMVEDVQSKLSKEFEMKDLGKLHYILGIEVSQLKKGDIFIS
ncbi:hypothetical protein L7F22_064335 [Adiantum nelumboides]|nr:hypothetical protein [Adiantum nelumboides]